MADNIQAKANTGSGTDWFATDDIGGVHYPVNKMAWGVADTATYVSATDPMPVSLASTTITGSVAVTGTFWQATQPVSGTFWQATQPVSGAFWQATQPVSGPLTDAQLRASAVPVSLASTTITGSVAVTGTFWQATQPVSGTFWQATQPVSGTVTVTPPTLTKGTQGATGFSTQHLRDGGRVIVNAATAIAGVTAVTTEALLTLNVSRDGAATSGVTTIAVTSGKKLRIIGVTAGYISTSAAVLSVRVALRMNPAGAVAATSPILCIIPMAQQAAALAQAGNEHTVMFSEAIEISGTMQVGLTQVASAITGTVWASLIAYEY